MAKTWAAAVIFVGFFSRPVGAASKFLTAASDELSISGPNKKSHKRKSAQAASDEPSISEPSEKMQKRNLGHHVAKKAKFPKVSAENGACFSALRLGASPGSTLGQTTESSVDACMSRCVGLEDCYAMSFRMSDGLCNAINRTYNTRFEPSDDRVLANKLAGCNHEYGTHKGHAEPADEKIAENGGWAASEEAQACFTDLVFGLSPGSTLGQTTEKSVDDCMMRCAGLEDCYAMSFQISDGLCNAINRTYEARFQSSSERLLANKLAGCNQAYGTPKGTKALEKAEAEKSTSSGIWHTIGKTLGMPFKFLAYMLGISA